MTGEAGDQDVDGRIRRTLDAFVSGDVALVEAATKLRGWVVSGSVTPNAVETVLREATHQGRLSGDAYRRLTSITCASTVDEAAASTNDPLRGSAAVLTAGVAPASTSAAETKYRETNRSPNNTLDRRATPPNRSVAMEGRIPLIEPQSEPQANDVTLSDPHAWTGVWGAEVAVGNVLSGRYRLERKLGEGGMGIVFLAVDLEDKNRQFAVKVLKSDFRRDPTMVRLLEDEVDNGRRLTHENIVAVYLLMRHQTHLYILMQYLEGKTLEQLLTDDYARGVPWNRAEPWIKGLGAGLAFAHDKGVIHSDIKPANAFITTAGVPKILDFGIARAVRGMRNAMDSGEMQGLTESYASYEMLQGGKPDVRDDIYSFACVVYELLTGRHPFEGESATTAFSLKSKPKPVPSLSLNQNRALERALALRRDDRTASVEEFLSGLNPLTEASKPNRTLILSVLFSVTILPLVGWFVWTQMLKPNSDERIVQSLLKPAASRSADYDATRVQEDLGMAADDVARAAKQFDAGLLSEGTSNAFDAYVQVLEVDPANRTAAEGVLAILKLYRKEARRLVREGRIRQAMDIARTALNAENDRRVAPDPELNSLAEDLAAKLGGVAGSITN